VERARTFPVVLMAFLVVAIASEPAFAAGRGRSGTHSGTRSGTHHHHHHHFSTGVFIGAPLFYYPRPYYYPAPYYAPYPAAPTYYVEQPQAGYWHYCRSAGAYYPQVQSCPEGWQLVSPQPQSGN